MFRKITSILCAVIIIISVFVPTMTANAQNDSVRARKIVSILYDDSGSMENEKWEYTSYAIQCFAAMLNKEDILDITYMSTHTSGALSIDTAKRKESVEEIRNHSYSAGTPIESIDSAYNAMFSHNDSNLNTQYWLIVMTDGQMGSTDQVESKINDYAEKTMPNGTKPHIIFMTICDTGNQFTPSLSKSNTKVVKALTADEVINTISDISCDIAGRFPVPKDDIDFIDKRTVKVRTDVPLYYMGVLTQRSSALVDSIVGVEGNNLQLECNVPVKLPEKYTENMTPDEIDALKGNVSLFCSTNSNIAPDTYTITFTEDISENDLVIMLEPAISLRLVVSSDGTVIDDLSTLAENQVVDIEAVLFEAGTNNRILPSMLPDTPVNMISLSENGIEVLSDNKTKIEGITLKALETSVSASVEIPGFVTVKDTIKFTPTTILLSKMTATVFYDGSERRTDKDGVVDADNVVYITDLDTNGTGVKFTLYIDDQPIDKETAKSLKDPFTNGLNLDFDNYKVAVCDDGSIIVYPSETKTLSLLYWLSHRGDSIIEASYGGKTAAETITFKMGDWWEAVIDIIKILILILVISYTLYWLFGKPHFKKNGSIKVFTTTQRNGEYVQDFGKTKKISWIASSGLLNFIGPRGMRKKVGNYYIRATKTGYEIKNIKDKFVSTSVPYPNSQSVSPSKEHSHRFTTNIYVYDGNTYYKFSI